MTSTTDDNNARHIFDKTAFLSRSVSPYSISPSLFHIVKQKVFASPEHFVLRRVRANRGRFGDRAVPEHDNRQHCTVRQMEWIILLAVEWMTQTCLFLNAIVGIYRLRMLIWPSTRFRFDYCYYPRQSVLNKCINAVIEPLLKHFIESSEAIQSMLWLISLAMRRAAGQWQLWSYDLWCIFVSAVN